MNDARRKAVCAAMSALSWPLWRAALAQDRRYPSRSIRLIIPFAPGSGADVLARVIAEAVAAQTGVSVVPEIMEGAGGAIGAAVVAKGPPDGYTLLTASTPMTLAPYMMKPMPYDPAKDFAAVVRVCVVPMVLVTSGKAPWNTFQDLIAHIRANPGKVNYATGGKGTLSHLEVELIGSAFGLQMQDIPYKSGTVGLTDTISQRVEFFVASLPAALGHIQSGALRALAVGSPNRVPALPDVPTLAEAMGKPNYEATVWYGFAMPSGTPPDVTARLDQEIRRAAATPSVRARIEQVGGLISLAGPPEFGTQIRSESEKWAGIVKKLKLTSE